MQVWVFTVNFLFTLHTYSISAYLWYAEIEKILKCSQTLKRHCIQYIEYELWLVIVHFTKTQSILCISHKPTVSLCFARFSLTFLFSQHSQKYSFWMSASAESVHFHTLVTSCAFTVYAVFTSTVQPVNVQFCTALPHCNGITMLTFGGVLYREQVLYFLYPEHSKKNYHE